jgi:hypothetical protein
VEPDAGDVEAEGPGGPDEFGGEDPFRHDDHAPTGAGVGQRHLAFTHAPGRRDVVVGGHCADGADERHEGVERASAVPGGGVVPVDDAVGAGQSGGIAVEVELVETEPGAARDARR